MSCAVSLAVTSTTLLTASGGQTNTRTPTPAGWLSGRRRWRVRTGPEPKGELGLEPRSLADGAPGFGGGTQQPTTSAMSARAIWPCDFVS